MMRGDLQKLANVGLIAEPIPRMGRPMRRVAHLSDLDLIRIGFIYGRIDLTDARTLRALAELAGAREPCEVAVVDCLLDAGPGYRVTWLEYEAPGETVHSEPLPLPAGLTPWMLRERKGQTLRVRRA